MIKMSKNETQKVARITVELEYTSSEKLYTQPFMHCDYKTCKFRQVKGMCHDGEIMAFSFLCKIENLPKCYFAEHTNTSWQIKNPNVFPGLYYEMPIKEQQAKE